MTDNDGPLGPRDTADTASDEPDDETRAADSLAGTTHSDDGDGQVQEELAGPDNPESGETATPDDDDEAEIAGHDARVEVEETIYCGECRAVIPVESDYCTECGAEQPDYEIRKETPEFLPSDKKYCADCGSQIDITVRFCGNCGAAQEEIHVDEGQQAHTTTTSHRDSTRDSAPVSGQSTRSGTDRMFRARSARIVLYATSIFFMFLTMSALVPTEEYPQSYVLSAVVFFATACLTFPPVIDRVNAYKQSQYTSVIAAVIAVIGLFTGTIFFG